MKVDPMTSALKAIDGSADLPALMTELVKGARAAARILALARRRESAAPYERLVLASVLKPRSRNV